MKKLISIVMVLSVALSLCSSVFAADYQVLDIGNATKSSILSISGTTATCLSQVSTQNTDISSIKITQTEIFFRLNNA